MTAGGTGLDTNRIVKNSSSILFLGSSAEMTSCEYMSHCLRSYTMLTHTQRHRRVIDNLMSYDEQDVIGCGKCHKHTFRPRDTFSTLSLHIDEESGDFDGDFACANMIDLIAKHFEGRTIEYTCGKCGKWSTGFEQTYIKALPDMLCVEIVRPQPGWDEDERWVNEKNCRPVNIAPKIDLSSYLEDFSTGSMIHHPSPSSSPISSSSERSKGSAARGSRTDGYDPSMNREPLASYSLYSVIKHRGTVSRGHYVNWSKCPKAWKELNDDRVSPSTLAKAISQDPITSADQKDKIFTPYLLFYQREYYDTVQAARLKENDPPNVRMQLSDDMRNELPHPIWNIEEDCFLDPFDFIRVDPEEYGNEISGEAEDHAPSKSDPSIGDLDDNRSNDGDSGDNGSDHGDRPAPNPTASEDQPLYTPPASPVFDFRGRSSSDMGPSAIAVSRSINAAPHAKRQRQDSGSSSESNKRRRVDAATHVTVKRSSSTNAITMEEHRESKSQLVDYPLSDKVEITGKKPGRPDSRPEIKSESGDEVAFIRENYGKKRASPARVKEEQGETRVKREPSSEVEFVKEKSGKKRSSPTRIKQEPVEPAVKLEPSIEVDFVDESFGNRETSPGSNRVKREPGDRLDGKKRRANTVSPARRSPGITKTVPVGLPEKSPSSSSSSSRQSASPPPARGIWEMRK